MKKFLLSMLAVATLATGSIATVSTASADQYGRHGWRDGGGRGDFYRGGGRDYRGGRDYYRGGGYGRGYDRGYRRHGNDGAAIGAGIVGLAAGALIGGAIANQRSAPVYGGDRYYGNQQILEGPVVYQERRVITRPAYREVYREPAVRGSSHVERCAARYKTYDSRTDTYIGKGMREYRCNL